MLSQVQACYAELKSWMNLNFLQANGDKTEFSFLGAPTQLANLLKFDIVLDETVISPTENVRNLGVIFDSNMSMVSHVNNVCRNAFYHLRNIGKIRQFLDQTIAEHLIHAFVTTRLDYCNSLLFGLPDCLIAKLQRVQNSAARVVTRNSKFCHITPLLVDLHWLPIKYRIQFKIIVLTYKCVNGLAPQYLQSLLSFKTTTRSLRSSSQLLLTQPRVKLVSAGHRAFCHSAPQLWNDLPFYLKSSESLDILKRNLKTHLFRKSFT